MLLWPTPRINGIGGGSGGWEMLKKKTTDYNEAKKMGAGNGGQLNPDWVKLLMGWPKGWTSLDDMETIEPWASWGGRPFWGSPAWEQDTPRVTEKTPHRKQRLIALGNGQVPICFVVAYNILSERLNGHTI